MILLIAGAASIAVGACSDEAKSERSCKEYCAQAKLCDTSLNEQKCVNSCVEAVGSCMADELEDALQQMDNCANESCDDFVGCTINAGAQCYFGL